MSASLHELAERLGKAREHCRWAEVAAVEGALMAWNKPRSAPASLPTMDIHPDLAADLAAMNAPHDAAPAEREPDKADLVRHAIKLLSRMPQPWDGKTFDPELSHTLGLLVGKATPSRAAGTEAVQAGEAVGELEVDELGATAFVNDTGRELPYGVYPLYVTRLLSEPAHGAVAQEAVAWQYRVSIDGKTYHDWSDWPNEERPAKIGRWDAEYRAIGVIAPAHPEAAKDAGLLALVAKWRELTAHDDCTLYTIGQRTGRRICADELDAALATSKSQGREA